MTCLRSPVCDVGGRIVSAQVQCVQNLSLSLNTVADLSVVVFNRHLMAPFALQTSEVRVSRSRTEL